MSGTARLTGAGRFDTLRSLAPVWAILAGAALMLSLSMGLRQSLGLFMPPITKGIGISVSDFTLAIAVQNLTWGLLQPLAGAWAVRVGYRPMMAAGAALYVAALLLLASAQGLLGVTLGAGVMIGAALACTGSSRTSGGAANARPSSLRRMATSPAPHSWRTTPSTSGTPPLSSHAWQLPSVGWPAKGISRSSVKMRTR